MRRLRHQYNSVGQLQYTSFQLVHGRTPALQEHSVTPFLLGTMGSEYNDENVQ